MTFSSRVSGGGGGGACVGGRRRVVVVAVEGRHFVGACSRSTAVDGSRWFGWEVVGDRGNFGKRVVVVVVAGSHATYVSFFAYS